MKQKHTGRLCVSVKILSRIQRPHVCLRKRKKKSHMHGRNLTKSRSETRVKATPTTRRRVREEARKEPAAVFKEGTSFRAPCVSLMWNSKCWQGGKPPRLPQDLIQIIKSPVQNVPVCLSFTTVYGSPANRSGKRVEAISSSGAIEQGPRYHRNGTCEQHTTVCRHRAEQLTNKHDSFSGRPVSTCWESVRAGGCKQTCWAFV